MSMTFGPGITLGRGITVGPYVVPAVDLRYDTNYIGTNVATDFNNTVLYDTDSGLYVCLTDQQMSATGRYMATFNVTYNVDPANTIGIATRSVDLNNYLGSDTQGLGIGQDQTLYWNGSGIDGGFPVWGLGDVVDVAVNNAAG